MVPQWCSPAIRLVENTGNALLLVKGAGPLTPHALGIIRTIKTSCAPISALISLSAVLVVRCRQRSRTVWRPLIPRSVNLTESLRGAAVMLNSPTANEPSSNGSASLNSSSVFRTMRAGCRTETLCVDKEDVFELVTIVIEDSHAASDGLKKTLLSDRTTRDMAEPQSGGERTIFQIDSSVGSLHSIRTWREVRLGRGAHTLGGRHAGRDPRKTDAEHGPDSHPQAW